MERIEEQLKLATKAKKDGDLLKAIDILIKTYQDISSTEWAYPVETYLRLPMYMQEAGQIKEAWQYFHYLLKDRKRVV